MISVQEAKSIIENLVQALPPVRLPLLQASGKKLAADVYAAFDIPAFPQSAMDGYAFAFTAVDATYEIAGEVAAGDSNAVSLPSGKAVRIFTGAPVPAGADTVIMQEKVRVENGELFLEDDRLQPFSNVRPVGSEIKAGELALPAGTLLSAAAIGFLAGIGVEEVAVVPDPRIALIVTGNELQTPGKPLMYGQVYESNSYSLQAALNAVGLRIEHVMAGKDNPDALSTALEQAVQENDLVLLTGGVSVGDYDFVLQAAARCGVTQHFHKVKQRPGKPLYFGSKGRTMVFGLPGNPASVLTCFYQYVLLALSLQTGRPLRLKTVQAPLASNCKKAPSLTHFQKGYFDGEKVDVLPAQESYRLSSFAVANCLMELEDHREGYSAGETITVHLFP